ncbi:MAG TPA: alpha-L-rhamnosidase C-terminal domain-containing protein [Tepidisphaeraceae bacterium]|nr:alpha-L-rhamnosidase C-terminal domain-containing protein [Tepidisphaeraceae bacterium]
MRHAPCLTIRLDVVNPGGSAFSIRTDDQWKWSDRIRYRTPRIEWGNVRDRIDARVESGDWTQLRYDDSSWKSAAVVDGSQWGPLTARRIPLLRESRVATHIAGNQSFPVTLNAGQEIHLDLDHFSQAYSVLDLDAEAGTELELTHAGIHYIARAGRQTYISSDTCGFKEAVIRVRSGHATIHSYQAVEVLYPFDCLGSFECSDDRLNRIWQMGVRSLQLTSEDAYVDCADRERTEWMDCDPPAFDVTRVAVTGPGADGQPVYADSRLLKEMLRRTALTQQPAGWVKAHTCSDRFDIHAYMEDRACDWVEGARRYYESTGTTGVIREIWPVIVSQMNWFLDHRTPRGLVRAREWVVWGNPVGYQILEGAGLNAFVYRALVDASVLGNAIGQESDGSTFANAAEKLAKAFNDVLWDEKEATYYSGYFARDDVVNATPRTPKLTLKVDNGLVEPTFFPALFALDQGIVPPARQAAVQKYMLAHRDQATRVMTFYYLYKQLYAANQSGLDQEVIDSITNRFLPMADTGWQMSWEEFTGASKAHCYGMFPTYFLSAYVLGVRLDGPIWNKRVLIEPRLADLAFAKGIVVTEFGPVAVSWSHRGQTLEFSVDAPKGIELLLRLCDTDENTLKIVNEAVAARSEGRYTVAVVHSPQFRGTINFEPTLPKMEP